MSVAQQESPVSRIILHVLLLIGLVASIFPFYWMIVMSTNTTSDIYRVPPKLFFGTSLWINVTHVLQNIDFFHAFFNTILVSCIVTFLVLLFCSLAGFTFAKLELPFKNTLFAILVGTVLLPSAGSVVALFVMMANLHWIGTFLPLIIPAAAPAFGIFWIRQYALGAIPTELVESVQIDGGGYLRQYWHVALPALRPALGWLGIMTFIGVWNDYYWPLIVLNDPKLYTLQVVLNQLNGLYNTDYSVVIAATLMATLPLLIVFFFGARQFISNISAGALKF
jgi:cellobiose transport system permease protein